MDLLTEKVNAILEEVKLPWSFTGQLAKFYKLYPNTDFDLDKMADLLLTSVYLFFLDDCIEESKENGLHWLDVLDDNIVSYKTPLDVLYQKYLKVFLGKLTEFQKRRMVTSFKDFVDCSIREHDERDTLLNMSRDEYVDFRVKNNLCGFQVCEAEYGLNLSIKEKVFNTSVMKRMWNNFSKYVSIVQDLYSYKKESNEKCGEINYINVTMKELNCGLGEAIDNSLNVLDQLEYEIHKDVLKLLDTGTQGLDLVFFKGIGNFLNSTLDFYKICGRYNNW